MDKVFNVLAVVLPVLAALALGWFARRRKILNDSAVESLKALVMRIMLPMVLLNTFYKADFSVDLVIMAVCMFTFCVLGVIVGKMLSRVCTVGGKLLPFFTSGFEAGMMGYGLYVMLFSEAERYNFAMVDLGQAIFIFTVYSALLNKQKGVSTKQTLKEMVTAPIFIAVMTGVVLSATGLGALIQQSVVGAPVDAVLDYIGTPTGVLMLFVVGYQLVWSKDSAKEVLLTTLLRTLTMAVLCAGMIFLLKMFVPMEKERFWAIVLMFSLPAPFALPIFSGDEKRQGYISAALSVGVVFSVLLFAVISVFVK